MIRYAIFFLGAAGFLSAAAPHAGASEKFWISFADKGAAHGASVRKSYTPLESERLLGITRRALVRRAKTSASGSIDELDLPVAAEYLRTLRAAGVVPVAESRWLNAVSAYMTAEQRGRIEGLPFVASIEPVRVHRVVRISEPASARLPLGKTVPPSASGLDYGTSLEQVQQINVPLLHDLNVTGEGVLVGMLDSGFRWRTHEALKNINVLGEYDFIQRDSVTSNQSGDSGDEDEHGTMTLSVLAGNMPGRLIGPAYGASFMLGKTEYVPAELNSEEDNWVAGLEWLERNGADIVSTSLGYSTFDAGQRSYTYADMNGRTALTTRAAAVAARKGMLVCVAMGNEGNTSWRFLSSPADADSLLAVGSVSRDGIVSSFSSVGPTSDGRTKPDVCARGLQDVVAVPVETGASTYRSVNGTSVATPLVAGAAALVLSARPELTPMQLREALRATASNAGAPNNSLGWGIIDAYKALLYHGLVISASLDVAAATDGARTIDVAVLSASPLAAGSLVHHYSLDGGATFSAGLMRPLRLIDAATGSGIYSFVLPNTATHFFITAADNSGASGSLPFTAPKRVFDANLQPIDSPVERPVIEPFTGPQSFELAQNYPNPFNGSTTIRYALTQASHVTVTVYDVLGRVAAVLVDDEREPGIYSAAWNAPSAASGVYFYSLRTREFSDTKKMILIR